MSIIRFYVPTYKQISHLNYNNLDQDEAITEKAWMNVVKMCWSETCKQWTCPFIDQQRKIIKVKIICSCKFVCPNAQHYNKELRCNCFETEARNNMCFCPFVFRHFVFVIDAFKSCCQFSYQTINGQWCIQFCLIFISDQRGQVL